MQIEPGFVILCLSVGAWFVSKRFLKEQPESRKKILRDQFKNLTFHWGLAAVQGLLYLAILELGPEDSPFSTRLLTYIGLGTIFSGALLFIKAWRILVFEYLFLSYVSMAFPVLLVNLFTLLLSMVLAGWIGAEIFSIQLTPLLATSAIFSIVLGMALQDTLGNLFAGVALQFDKPYEIGDWIEVQNLNNKSIGQVTDISWRATILISSNDEILTIPNRIVSQAQITNFSTRQRPIMRSLVFRLPFGVNVDTVKSNLLKAVQTVPRVRDLPSPKVMITDTTESGIGFRLQYAIDNYGEQSTIADQVYSKGIHYLEKAGYNLSNHQVTLTQKSSSSLFE